MNSSYAHLKRHVPTNLAILAGFASGAMLVAAITFMSVPRGYTAARGDPRYWLVMLPLIVWTWGAASLNAWALRLLAIVLLIAPAGCAAVALLAGPGRPSGDIITLWVLAAAALVFAGLGGLALSRSPLWPFQKGR